MMCFYFVESFHGHLFEWQLLPAWRRSRFGKIRQTPALILPKRG